MKTVYVCGTDDGYVKTWAYNFKDFKHQIQRLKFTGDFNVAFDDIDSILLFIYDENKYNVDYGMDGQLYVENLLTGELEEKDFFEDGDNDISCVQLDKNEMFMLNSIYKSKHLVNNYNQNEIKRTD